MGRPALGGVMTLKKKLIWFAVSVFGIVLVVGGAGLWALLQVPEFYTQASAALPKDPVIRQEAAKQMIQRTTDLVNKIETAEAWTTTFEQTQINSWLAEELTKAKYADVVPEGVSQPRVMIGKGDVKVGFRVRQKGWSGIVSLAVRPWVTEDNQLALEIETVRAGLIPVPIDKVLVEATDRLREHGWKVTWKQSNGNDVAVVRLNEGEKDAPVLESIEIEEEAVTVIGRRRDARRSERPRNGQIAADPRSHRVR